MKIPLALITISTLLTQIALADSSSIIKQRAKELVKENNVRQGVAPPTQAPSAPGTATPAPPPQSPNIARLQADLAGLKADVPATAEQKQKLAQDLMGAAETGTKPTPDAANAMAEALAAAFNQKPLSSEHRARLVTEIDAVLNPSKYPQAKMEGIFADVQAIFQSNGLSRTDSVKVVNALKTLCGKA
jgi:hypothetical protein